MIQSLSQWRQTGRDRLRRWFSRRGLPAVSHLLGRDRLYIFPTATGFVFCGLLAVLWTLGTNYQNNLILGLCLLLSSLFILAILRTHNNLAGLEVRLKGAGEAFAGDMLAFHLELRNATPKDKDGIRLGWEDEALATVALDGLEARQLPVRILARRRGWLQPPRLRVETVFPLGLLRCWTWLRFDTRALVYPKPRRLRDLQPDQIEMDEETAQNRAGGNDFAGLRDYAAGDPLRQIAWKHFARGKGLVSKQFNTSLSEQLWLGWDSLEGLQPEERLSTLCYWAVHCDQAGATYGLELPGQRLTPGSGPAHRQRVLQALALYRQEKH